LVSLSASRSDIFDILSASWSDTFDILSASRSDTFDILSASRSDTFDILSASRSGGSRQEEEKVYLAFVAIWPGEGVEATLALQVPLLDFFVPPAAEKMFAVGQKHQRFDPIGVSVGFGVNLNQLIFQVRHYNSLMAALQNSVSPFYS